MCFPCPRRTPGPRIATTRSTSRCTSARSRTRTGSGREQAKRLDWIKPPTRIKNVDFADDVRSAGSRTAPSTSRQLHRPAPRDARRPDRDHLGGRRPERRREDHLPRAARAGLQARQRAEGARRQEGRPGHHLHADDPRGRLRHAGLRADRRGPLGGVRRLLAGQPGRPHQRLRQQAGDHRRRGPARRPQRPAQAEHRRGARALRRRRQGADVPPHRHRRADDRRPRPRRRSR